MGTVTSNNYKYLLGQGKIDLSANTFKVVLMAPGFTFNRATADEYSDVSASELPTANGYTAGGTALSGGSYTRDDSYNSAYKTFDTISWEVVTAPLTACGAIIYDSSVTGNPVVGFIDFLGNQTTQVGGTLRITGIIIPIT